MNRREILITGVGIGLMGFSGCFSEPQDETDGTVQECEIDPDREEQGKGDPVEVTTTVGESEITDSNCPTKAAELAIDSLDDHLEIDLESASWIVPTYKHDENRTYVTATSSKEYGSEEWNYCPDTEWDFDEAVRNLPSDVTITVEDENEEVQRECEYDIYLEHDQLILTSD